MPVLTFADLDPLFAAEMNSIANQLVITATSFPVAPVEGMRVLRTDTSLEYTYDGAAWQLVGEQCVGRTVLGVAGATILVTLPAITNGVSLRCVATVQNSAGTAVTYGLRFNADAGNNYFWQRLGGANVTAFATIDTSDPYIFLGTHGNESASRWSIAEALVHDFAGAAHKSASVRSYNPGNAGTTQAVEVTGGVWSNTAAITSVSAICATNNFAIGSSLAVYVKGGYG